MCNSVARYHIRAAAFLVVALVSFCARGQAGPAVGRPAEADSAGLRHSPEPLQEFTKPSLLETSSPVEKKIGDNLYLFVFATIADSHIRYLADQDLRYLKDMTDAPELLRNYVHDINDHDPAVDFAVHLGDITDLGRGDEFAIARQILDSLRCPLYPVLGNHDNFQSDNKQGWYDFAGRLSADYTFDIQGFHFIVIDCTLNPYAPPYVDCDAGLRQWVADDLAANAGKPTILFSHYNMWKRPWNPMFDTTLVYAEYRGMPELRQILENAGNVVAVINGHVHANRVEIHNGIYYIDIGATLVGPPSIRYFYVYPNRIEVNYKYISDQNLFNRVTSLCPFCNSCFNPNQVCAFIDGLAEYKQFVMPVGTFAGVPATPPDSTFAAPRLSVRRDATGHIRASVSSASPGVVEISLNDVLGRGLGRCTFWKESGDLDVDLTACMTGLDRLPVGIYFVRATVRGAAATSKLALIP